MMQSVGGSSKGDSCASSKGDTEKDSISRGFDVSSAIGEAQTNRQSMTAAATPQRPTVGAGSEKKNKT
jgi:hypothetical protein